MDAVIQFLNSTSFTDQWLVPLAIVAGCTLAGMIFKRVVHSRLIKAAERSTWEGDNVILAAVESHIILWFFLLALSLALRDIPIDEHYGLYISKILKIILIASITHASAKLVVGLFDIWSKQQGSGFPSTTIFTNIVWITVYAIGLLIIFDSLNVSIAPMLTALGVGGVGSFTCFKGYFIRCICRPAYSAEQESSARRFCQSRLWGNGVYPEYQLA
jgi:small-conductance mechanosensitive channel